MYEPFYGLTMKPFSIIPDPRFLFWAGPHSMAFAMLEYGILNHAGFTVITGEIGAGKTTLIRHLLERLPEDVNVGLLSNTPVQRGDLLRWVLMAFDQEYEGISEMGLYRRFETYLKEQHALGRRTVLIVDEAQNLGSAALEELRMVSNVNTYQHELLQIVLSGQPQLKALLSDPALEQFAQRVSSDFHLGLLGQSEVTKYIDHRLQVAGARRVLFSNEACKLVYEASRGTPRLVNILCDTSLMYGYAVEANVISSKIVKKVILDKQRHGVFPARLGIEAVTK
jgi:general secretion pathway protein A